ncbi:MAG TPA: CopD family protein [Symbiobacteriaceae bacterium]|nr:CopD family protein [Symbiobacteriaceae bacterium]
MATGALRVPRVLDRYVLPKVAFVVITGASMAGAALTGLRHGVEALPLLALRWAAAWVLALLLGSQIWKIFYLRPAVNVRPVPGAIEYGEAMIALHVRWQRVLSVLAVLLVGGMFAYYAATRPVAVPSAVAGGVALLTAIVWSLLSPGDARRQDAASWVVLGGLAATAAAIGTMDVALQLSAAPVWTLAINRVLHLWAFSAWLGGALWNIFIAVPAGMQRINMDTVILANFQLERFRVVVRTVFPVIITTGLVQAWAMFGWNWEALFTNVWGYLVLTKVGLIVALVGIFIACPMWKACSPIRGVCDLDDL